jgi:hypothetical protein
MTWVATHAVIIVVSPAQDAPASKANRSRSSFIGSPVRFTVTLPGFTGQNRVARAGARSAALALGLGLGFRFGLGFGLGLGFGFGFGLAAAAQARDAGEHLVAVAGVVDAVDGLLADFVVAAAFVLAHALVDVLGADRGEQTFLVEALAQPRRRFVLGALLRAARDQRQREERHRAQGPTCRCHAKPPFRTVAGKARAVSSLARTKSTELGTAP